MKFTAILATAILLATGVQETIAATLNPVNMLRLVNEFRASNGRHPLDFDGSLMQAAQIHSNMQAYYHQMEHDLPGEARLMARLSAQGVSWNFAAENISENNQNENDAMTGWINSPDHRNNLLSDVTHFGVGLAIGSNGKSYWTQTFGKSGSLPRINA